ncbi:MAG: flagellar basal body L-ring protein FlgH [Pseudomonadales bacterium]|jgi:flagellar L-ring protein precursor FlgH
MNRCILLIIACFGAAGCETVQQPMQNDPFFAPKYPVAASPAPQTSGSLFATSGYTSLYDDAVARRVGDIITVQLNEQTSSSKSASTSVSKDSSTDMGEPTIFGKRLSVPPANNLVLTGVNNETEFSGTGNSDQSNSLSGSIAVTITEVLPNGSFVVRGEKWMRLNQGDEFIRISGMVRPVDVSSNNTVQSTRIANARISYGGKGTLNDSNRMGWLSRFFISPLLGY